jgi:hypothetical protein
MAIAFVQATAVTSTGSGTSLTRTITPAAGNMLVAVLAGSTVATSFSDGVNTWNIDRQATSAATERIAIGSAPNVAGTTVTITASFPSGSGSLVVLEYSGIATSSHVDDTDSGSGFSQTIGTGSVTTTQDDSLIVCGACINVNSGARPVTQGSNFDERAEGGSPRAVFAEDRIVSATGNYAGSATFTGGNAAWSAVTVAYKGAAATGHPAVKRMGGVRFASHQQVGHRFGGVW